MNTLAASEIKRRGIGAIDPFPAVGPVHTEFIPMPVEDRINSEPSLPPPRKIQFPVPLN
jgi:hypothetical protein